MTSSDSAGEEVNTAIEEALGEVFVLIDDDDHVFEFLDSAWELLDGEIHVSFTVPKTAEGVRLTITLKIEPDAPGSTKVVAYTVAVTDRSEHTRSGSGCWARGGPRARAQTGH